MRIQFICFVLVEFLSSLLVLSISRLFMKEYKAGMIIFLFSNCINLLISSFTATNKVFYNLDIIFLCLCFTFCTVFYYISFYLQISSVTFANYYSLRIIIVGILSVYILQKKLTCKQVGGKVLVAIGVCIQLLMDKPLIFKPFILTAIASALFNAMAAVLFESRIKGTITNTFEYIFTFNICYLPFNLIAAYLEYKDNKIQFLVKNWIFYILILLNVFSTHMSLYLSMNCDSFERTIISNICGLFSYLVSDLIILNTINNISLVGFTFVSLGIYLYATNNKRIEENKKELTTSS